MNVQNGDHGWPGYTFDHTGLYGQHHQGLICGFGNVFLSIFAYHVKNIHAIVSSCLEASICQ